MSPPIDPSDLIPRGFTTATLNFFSPPPSGVEPVTYPNRPDPITKEPTRTFTDNTHIVTITDIRYRATPATLKTDAFQLISSVPTSQETSWTSDEQIKQRYYPEVDQLLRSVIPSVNKVVIFDHTVRRESRNKDDPDSRGPVNVVHVDQTATSVVKRVHKHSPDDAVELLKGRYGIINVWRPLFHPVESHPLAFASAASVDPEDLVPVRHQYEDGYTGETGGVKYNPGQEWYYVSGVRPDERILIQCFDSKKWAEDRGGRVPHSAFMETRTRAGAPPRESIEVRALVFSDE